MPLVLGLDGGQTGTRAAILDSDGNLVSASSAGPSWQGGTRAQLTAGFREVRRALDSAVSLAGEHGARIAAVGMGMTAVQGLGERVAVVYRAAATEATRAQQVSVVDDRLTNLLGASGGESGVVVIAGGGTAAFGRAPDGREATASGWGYLLGDEGSGYQVGRAAINASLRALDGRGEATLLCAEIVQHFHLESLAQIKAEVQIGRVSVKAIADFAGLVGLTAARGDHVAQRILREAGRSSAESAIAVLRRLELAGSRPGVYTTGGLFRERDFYRPAFVRAVHLAVPDARILEPRYSSLIGCVLLAFQSVGIAVTESVRTRLDDVQRRLDERERNGSTASGKRARRSRRARSSG